MITLDTRNQTATEALQTTKDYCRALLEQWGQYEKDEKLLEFISALRWYLSHDRWPRKTEGTLSFKKYDYQKIQKWPLQQIVNSLRKIVSCVFTLNSPEYPTTSLKKRTAQGAKDATINYLLVVQPVEPLHPDYMRKWNDPKKCLPDGTKVWEDSGIPRMTSLVGRPGEFMKHGGGSHDYNGFMKAMKNYDRRTELEALKNTPPKNKVKTEQEVAEAMALKNKQREEGKRKREALDAENKRQFDAARKKHKKDKEARRRQ